MFQSVVCIRENGAGSGRSKLLDGITTDIGDVKIARFIEGQGVRTIQAGVSEYGDGAIGRNFLDRIFGWIVARYIKVAGPVEGQPSRKGRHGEHSEIRSARGVHFD